MLNPSSEHIAEMFAAHGLRCTKQRRVLYEALMATKAHPTAETLYQTVLPHCPGMSLATVYNTMEAFCESGLVQKIPGSNGSARYDGTAESHVHLRLSSTGAVQDLPMEMSSALLGELQSKFQHQIEEQLGFKIQRIHVEMVGDYASQA